MLSTTLALLSFTSLVSATDEGSAFGEDVIIDAPRPKKLTLRKPAATAEESESAFGDVDILDDVSEKTQATSSSKPDLRKKPAPVSEEESAFGDVDYLRDVAEDAHAAPSSPPTLRRKHGAEDEESAFGDGPQDEKAEESFAEKKIEPLDGKESLVEEAALGGELKDDAGDNLDDQEMKAESEERSMERSELDSAPKHNEGLDSMWDTKSAVPEDVKDESSFGGDAEVRPTHNYKCVGALCEADKWSPVRNVHAYGPSGKPANWKPRRFLSTGGEQEREHEQPRPRGARIYSRHMAVDHQAPPKRTLGEFVNSLMER